MKVPPDPRASLPQDDAVAAGARFERRIPEGDDRNRLVCRDCGFVAYENPKIVVGSVAAWEGRILLCRRAIEPRRGFWTLPAGFLELHETAAAGARREAWERSEEHTELQSLMRISYAVFCLKTKTQYHNQAIIKQH